jgi:hypothetical protein
MVQLFAIPGFNIYLQLAVTIISICVHLYFTRNTKRKETIKEILLIYVIGLSGWFGIMSGLFGHIIYDDQIASSIGWPLNSGFQMELGFASIGIGLVGFLGFWNQAYWLPSILMRTIFGWGAGFTHILHMFQFNNFSPGNIGVVLYWDFIWPVISIALFLLHKREQGREKIWLKN